jgi:hypothetical protein
MSVGDPPIGGDSYYYQVQPPEIDYERLAEEIVKRLPPPLPPVCPCPAPYYPVYPQPYYPWWPGITWTTTAATNISIDTSAGA